MERLEKLLRRVPPKHRVQILQAMYCLQDVACRSTLRPEKLSGSSLYRIHVGRYRIIFNMTVTGIEIVRVRLRNERTYRDIWPKVAAL